MKLIVGMAFMAFSIIAQSAEFRAITLTGRLEKGPCAGAITLVTSDNRRYELSAVSITSKPGESLSINGKLYPRISICKSYPWIDVDGKAEQGNEAIRVEAPTPAALSLAGNAMLVVTVDKLSEALREVRSFKATLPASLTFSIGVLGNPRDMMAQLLRATREDLHLIDGVQISAISDARAGSVILQSGNNEVVFANTDEFLLKTAGRAKQAS